MNMTMTAAQKADRLALIKKIAEKQNSSKAFRTKMGKKKVAARRGAEYDLERLAKDRKKFDREMEKLNENHNLWTDSSSYAEKYYGDVYRETTKFDNDWN
jgi:hypothetical protein